MFVLNKGPAVGEGTQTWVAGQCFTFHRYRNRSGTPVWAARLPDELDAKARLEVIGQCARSPHLDIHKHDDLVRDEPGAAAPVLEQVVGEEPGTPWDMALTHGWTEDDLAGTFAQGDAGDDGGRSPVTGLTTAEMALTRPPSDWPTARDTSYPWESGDWTPPTPLWTPPNPPDKVPPEGEGEGEGDASTTDDPPQLEDGGGETDPEEAETVTEGGSDQDELPDDPGTTADDDDPAVVAGYPPEHVGRARLIVAQLAEKRGGPLTHPNQANFLLKRADMPTVNTEQLDALQT